MRWNLFLLCLVQNIAKTNVSWMTINGNNTELSILEIALEFSGNTFPRNMLCKIHRDPLILIVLLKIYKYEKKLQIIIITQNSVYEKWAYNCNNRSHTFNLVKRIQSEIVWAAGKNIEKSKIRIKNLDSIVWPDFVFHFCSRFHAGTLIINKLKQFGGIFWTWEHILLVFSQLLIKGNLYCIGCLISSHS